MSARITKLEVALAKMTAQRDALLKAAKLVLSQDTGIEAYLAYNALKAAIKDAEQ